MPKADVCRARHVTERRGSAPEPFVLKSEPRRQSGRGWITFLDGLKSLTDVSVAACLLSKKMHLH